MVFLSSEVKKKAIFKHVFTVKLLLFCFVKYDTKFYKCFEILTFAGMSLRSQVSHFHLRSRFHWYLKHGWGLVIFTLRVVRCPPLVLCILLILSWITVFVLLKQMLKERGTLTNIPIYLVGNKTDLVGDESDLNLREVTPEEGQETSTRWGCGFIETSARDNYNVDQLFRRLLAMETARSLSLEASGAAKAVRTCVIS